MGDPNHNSQNFTALLYLSARNCYKDWAKETLLQPKTHPKIWVGTKN